MDRLLAVFTQERRSTVATGAMTVGYLKYTVVRVHYRPFAVSRGLVSASQT